MHKNQLNMTSATGKRDISTDVLRQLADSAPMIVWEIDIDNRCIYLNPDALRGLSGPDAINPLEWLKLIHPVDFPDIYKIWKSARKNRKEYQLEYRIVRSDGTFRWMMETGAPRFSESGQLKSYVGTIVDVTERQEARERLVRSVAEHRLLTEHAGDLISHSDADNRYVYASPSHRDILGYEPEELKGTQLYDYIHPDDLKLDRNPPSTRAPGQRPRLVNIRFRHKNGEWVWLGASTRTIRDPLTGKKTGMVSVARDITAQLEAARELARREERFRSLTSLSSDWYWEVDAAGRFIFISDGIFTRLGVRPEQFIGTTFESHVTDTRDPGFVACTESMTARRPFRDFICPVNSTPYPEAVRYLRISGEPFTENGVFCGYRGVTHDVTDEIKTARDLERLATRDTLTGLPNRALLETRLKQRLNDRRGDVPQAVFFIDLDAFKEVNDSLGHGAGDTLLKEIAERLKHCVRPDDIVARLGGDEFVVVAECKRDSLSAASIAGNLYEALEKPAMIAGHEVKVRASTGISMYPQDGETSEILLQNADTALYRVKAAGGKTFSFFTAEMGVATKMRLAMQAALRHALERDEFEVHYQPRVNLTTLEMTGMEALLRWTHPEMGAISPAEFIPLAEETGLIDEIGDWVLQRATSQAEEWITRYNRPLRLSVNLSARQLRNKNLVASVAHALRASCLPAHLLELELTETGLVEDPDLAARLLKDLKAFGLRLSVDDFGTGYSSLSYLCRFPLDTLKLDRSFLLHKHSDDVSPRKLAKAIINLAHTLNLSVVAEGVETREHLEFLRKTSCDEIQGFCISRPIPAAEFEKILREALPALPIRDLAAGESSLRFIPSGFFT
jgi:diguanylate cyclase (GGDEF)-like protein/PAS domain S-box-containing protein